MDPPPQPPGDSEREQLAQRVRDLEGELARLRQQQPAPGAPPQQRDSAQAGNVTPRLQISTGAVRLDTADPS